MDSAALNKQAIACAKHYMGKTAWPTMLLTAAVVAAFTSKSSCSRRSESGGAASTTIPMNAGLRRAERMVIGPDTRVVVWVVSQRKSLSVVHMVALRSGRAR